MAQAAFGPRAGRTLAITGGFEFGNKASLLVLMESTCDLPHHDARRIAIVGQVVALAVSTRTLRAISARIASSCVTN